MADLKAAEKALAKAKVRLMTMKDTAFWVSICLAMRHQFDTSVETGQTDGTRIWYNPDFLMGMDQDEQLFLLVHEVSHVAFDHMGRLNGREGVRWNKAADHAINLMWKARGISVPKSALCDPQYIGMSAEEIYELLPPEPPQNPNQAMGPGGAPSGSHLAPPTAEAKAHQQQHKEMLMNAAIQSKAQGDAPGTVPGSVELELDKFLKPKLPSKVLLQRYFNRMSRGGRNWSRPNKRYSDVYLPQRKSRHLGHVAVAVDASGSVSDEEFKRFISEVAGIFESCFPQKISLITFDTRIRQVDEVHSMQELLAIKFIGRGGTDIEDVLLWARDYSPEVMMVFTDGYFHFPDPQDMPATKGTDFLWLIHDNEGWKPPLGSVVHYGMRD